MRPQARDTRLLMGLLTLGLGCGGTMGTGTAKKPVNNKPAADGTCPAERSLCGAARFAVCVDMQNDPDHCGTCEHACPAGIACQAGVCQQTVCTTGTVPFSGQPDGTPSDNPAWLSPVREVLADVNGDGRLDRVDWTILGANPDPGTFRLSLGRPAGGFGAPERYDTAASVMEILVTDVNDDGLDDLFVRTEAYASSEPAPYYVELWYGRLDGRLTPSRAPLLHGTTISGGTGVMSDLSGDGWPDLVVQAANTESGNVDVYLSDSTGALHLSQTLPAGWVMRMVAQDWDEDGVPDIATLGDSMKFLRNRGDGRFDVPLDCALALGTAAAVVLEDLNADGKLDLALGNAAGRVGIMLGMGPCGFSPIKYYDIPGSANAGLRATDLNGDGRLDLVAINSLGSTKGGSYVIEDHLLSVLLAKPDGSFEVQDAALSLGPGRVWNVAIGEVTGDGRPDVLVSSSDGSSRTWENGCQ